MSGFGPFSLCEAIVLWFPSLLQRMWSCRSSVVFIWSWRLRGRDLCGIVWLFCGMSFVCPYSHSPIRQFVLWVGVFALRPCHVVLGKVFPWRVGFWRDPLIIKSIFMFNNNGGKGCCG
jgi:hypothetical protein